MPVAEPRVDTTVLDAAALLAIAMGRLPSDAAGRGLATARMTLAAPVGAWRNADGTVRLDVRTDGTYASKVAGRKRTARGTYRVEGATLTLADDSGLRTPVTVRDGVLEMAGHRLGPA